MAYLHVVYSNGHELKFEITKALVRIGRHSVNDLQLADDAASRLHAEICRKPGRYVVRDLRSKNGVSVNEQLVTEHALADGDHIEIGNVSLHFHLDDNESLADTVDVELVEEKKKSGPIVQAKRSMTESQILQADWGLAANFDATELQNRLKSITGLCRHLMTAQSPDDLIDETMDEIIRHLPYDRGCMMLSEGEQDQLVPKAVRDQRKDPNEGGKIAVSMTIAETCLRERSGVLCTDASRDKRFTSSESVHALQLHSVLCVPLLGSERPLGIIHLESRADHYVFNEIDLDYLMGVASELSVGLEHMQLRENRAHQERMGLIGQTISSLSSHVRRILDTAQESNHMLEEAIAAGDLERVRSAWQVIKDNNDIIGRLLGDMVQYTESDPGETVLANVNSVVTDVVEALAEEAATRGVEPMVQLDQQVADGYFNAEALRYVLLNLGRNALEAVENADAREVVIIVDQTDANLVNVVVQDSGPGLAPGEKERVFEPFFSPRGTYGTGLRLAIVQKLIVDIGGRIECESEPGLGTTFVLTIPMRKQAPGSEPPPPPRRDPTDPETLFDED